MKTDRPIIDVPRDPFDVIIDLASLSIILLIIGYTLFSYSDLPETIPTHFNGKGIADGFGNKITLWILPGIALFTFIGLFFLNKYPHLHNYMVNITKENALKNYRFSTRILRLVNFLCVVLFAFIQYKMIQGTNQESVTLGRWFLPIVIGVSVILPILLIIYQNKMNSK